MKAPVLSVQAQVEFCLAPPGYCPRYIIALDLRVEGSSANQCYLDHYKKLFDDEGERPVPTWPTLTWILEDYGLSRTKKVATDLVYRQQSGPFEPPPMIQLHPQFCCNYLRKLRTIVIDYRAW